MPHDKLIGKQKKDMQSASSTEVNDSLARLSLLAIFILFSKQIEYDVRLRGGKSK